MDESRRLKDVEDKVHDIVFTLKMLGWILLGMLFGYVIYKFGFYTGQLSRCFL